MPKTDAKQSRVEVFETTRDAPMVVVSYELMPRCPVDLSPAEEEVVVLMMKGRSNAEIADARGTSVHTVTNQVANIFRTMGVNTRSEVALKLWDDCADCKLTSCRGCSSR